MRPRLRKLGLTAHVTASVGWLGAVAAFLVLAIAGLSSDDPQLARSAYLAAKLVTSFVIVPLCLGSLVTGIVQSLGTSWGLFRHYWVFVKLLLTVVATVLLLAHTRAIGAVAQAAATTSLAGHDLTKLRVQLCADAGAALVVLVVATVLGVYKPKGLTRYGWRRRRIPLA